MAYSALLSQAQAQYDAIIAGYNQALAYQTNVQQAIQAGYNQLNTDVLGGIRDIGKAQSVAIADRYTAQAGKATQGLINAGLGNTTVTAAIGRGLTLDEAKAQNELQERVANLRAGYQERIGLASLGYRGQALRDNTALQGAQLGYMSAYQQQLGNWGMQEMSLNQQREMAALYGRGGGGGGINRIGGGSFSRPAGADYNPLTALGFRETDPFVNLNQQYSTPSSFVSSSVPYGGGGGYVPSYDTAAAPYAIDYLGGGGWSGGQTGYSPYDAPSGIGAWDAYGEY